MIELHHEASKPALIGNPARVYLKSVDFVHLQPRGIAKVKTNAKLVIKHGWTYILKTPPALLEKGVLVGDSLLDREFVLMYNLTDEDILFPPDTFVAEILFVSLTHVNLKRKKKVKK